MNIVLDSNLYLHYTHFNIYIKCVFKNLKQKKFLENSHTTQTNAICLEQQIYNSKDNVTQTLFVMFVVWPLASGPGPGQGQSPRLSFKS